MKLNQSIYSSRITKIALLKKKGNLKLNKCNSYIQEMNLLNKKINEIYLKSVMPEINKKHDYYSRQMSQSNMQVKRLYQKKLKEENEKYLKRIFSHENPIIYPKNIKKKIELPSISNNYSKPKKEIINNENKNFLINKPKIKFISNAKNEKKNIILFTKITETKKYNEIKDEIKDEIIIKSKEEKKIEEENKIKEEKEIKEEIEKKDKLKEEIKQKEIIEKKILSDLKQKNGLNNLENKKNLENFHKEQKIINKKNTKDKIKLLNTNITNIKDKNIKYNILKEIELLIKHGAQLSLENQNQLSNEIDKLITEYDNESFELILNIINSMLNAENNFSTFLLKNIIKILNKNKNITEITYEKALKLLIKINEELGIIDGTEDLFWNNLSNKKLFSVSLKGIHYLIQNCYVSNEKNKLDELIDLLIKNYSNSDKEIKNIICNIIQNISAMQDFKNKNKLFNIILNILKEIDIKNDKNYVIYSKILENIINSKNFDIKLIIEKQNIFENFINNGKINEHLLNIIKSIENKTNNSIINEFIKFNKSIIEGENTYFIKEYIKNNNINLDYMEYLLPYIEKNLDKKYFIYLLYNIANKNKILYKKINLSNLFDNINNDLKLVIKIIDDGVLFMNKIELEKIFIPKFESIIFDNEINENEKIETFNLIMKFIKKNNDIILTKDLKDLYEIYHSEKLNKKIIELIKNIFIAKNNLPLNIINKILNSKFDSSCEGDIYDLLEILISENCLIFKQKLGNNFKNLCNKLLEDKSVNIPKIIKTLINNEIQLEEEIYKLLGDKLNKRLNSCFYEKKDVKAKFALLSLMRYFNFNELDNVFQNYLIININNVCKYEDKDNILDKKFMTKYLYKLFIYYVLNNNENFNKYKNALFEMISKSEFNKEIDKFNNYKEFLNYFKNFDFLEELLVFTLAFSYEVENEKKFKIIKEKIKNLKEKKFEQKIINNILYFINELVDNYLISGEEVISLLDKYVLDYNFNNFDAVKDSKLIVFKNIRKNWIEKNIEKIGIIKNKKYLLDFILENNYSDKDIEQILKVFQKKIYLYFTKKYI